MMFDYWTKSGVVWLLNSDPSISFYIQPGGCFEFQQVDNGEHTWPHFCSTNIDAIRETVIIWQADRKERNAEANANLRE